MRKAGLSQTAEAIRAPKPLAAPSPSKRRTNKERSLETQRKLIDSAVRILSEQGYGEFTIAKVTRRAGLTAGAVQHHFLSKQELVLAVLKAVYPVLDISMADMARSHATDRERLMAFIDTLWEIYRRPEYLVIWEIALATRSDPQMADLVGQYRARIVKRMTGDLPLLLPGTKASAETVAHMASLVTSTLRGMAMLEIFPDDRNPEAELDALKVAALAILEQPSRNPAALARGLKQSNSIKGE